MLFRRLRQSRISKVVLFWLIPALLLSLGLRVCLHAYDDPTHAAHATDVSPIHIESTLSALGDHDENASDIDAPFAAVLKNLTAKPMLGALIVALLSLLLPAYQPDRFLYPRGNPSRLYRYFHFSPPSRAPPR